MRIEALAQAARALAAGEAPVIDAGAGPPGARGSALVPGPVPAARTTEPLRHETADLEGAFFAALASGDARTAVAALLDLDAAIEGRIRGGEDSPDLDNARSTFRSLIVRLGEAATGGASGSDLRATVEPFVEALLVLRARAREARDWAAADLVRDRLTGVGVEVHDGPDGSTWTYSASEPR